MTELLRVESLSAGYGEARVIQGLVALDDRHVPTSLESRDGRSHGLQPGRRRPRGPELRPHRPRDAPRAREVPQLLQLS